MPKTGKPDSYWKDIMQRYANGEYTFSTGKKPGSSRWKAVIKQIDDCPLHRKAQTRDLLGRQIPCKCGYHKKNQETTTQQTSSSATKPLPESSLKKKIETTTQQTSSSATKPLPESSLKETTTQQTSSSATSLKCGLCKMLVQFDDYTSHLLEKHAAKETISQPLVPQPDAKTVPQRDAKTVPQPDAKTVPQPDAKTVPQPDAKTVPQPDAKTVPQHDAKTVQQPVAETVPQPVAKTVPQPVAKTVPQPDDISVPQPDDIYVPQPDDISVPQPDNISVPQPDNISVPQPDDIYVPQPDDISVPQPDDIFVPQPDDISVPQPDVSQPAWDSFLPKTMKRNIQPGDVEWISKCLYDSAGHLKETFPCQNWYLPPHPRSPTGSAPLPHNYFRQRMFLWAPMRMWHIPLKCPSCRHPLSHSGIYPKVREVIDMDTRYYLVGGDYPKCNKCKVPYCPWNPDLLSQLDPSHRSIFPAVLTKYNALDRKIVTMMKPRTQGNSSSYIQQSVHELHSEEWGRCCLLYMADCELHKKGAMITGAATTYQQPPPFRPLPLAQWFQTAHSHEILDHVEEMKGVITSTYGRVLKLDSTKKVTKKLAGDVSESASWMTNIANEHGQVLNSVLTTGEGPALIRLCQGIVQRYNNAGEPEPDIIYVDRDCCSQSGKNPVLDWFKPWTCTIRLDIFHFMRRFTRGLTTEHHPLYGTFCSKLSNCIFAWDEQDYKLLKEAKTAELKRKYRGVSPSDYQTTSSISSAELARHCKRRTKPIADIKQSINMLLDELWDRTDSTGLRLINEDSMRRVWSIQEKHLECIQDPPGVELYTVKGTLEKGGKILNVYKCARGSSSLESFHKHQCTFVPGWNANASHMQMYMMEGSSRWNQNRARDAVELPSTSATKMYDVRLMSAINAISQRVLNIDLIPEFQPPGRPTDELIAVDFLLAQSGKGDHRPSETFDKDDEKRFLPELDVEEATEEVEFDCTVSSAVDIEHLPDTPKVPSSQGPVHMSLCDRCGVCLNTGEMVTHAITCTSTVQKIRDSPSPDMQISEEEEEEEDSFLNTRHDAHGFPGWEKVDTLSAYLVDQLDTTATSLTVSESNQIIRMYAGLHQIDKSPTKYARKSKKEVLPGPWRASRKRSGSSPGVQASERLYKTHGRAAQSPDTNRISECICIRLWRIYQYVRNRPKDAAGKTLQVSHAIVKHYSLIQQLLEDCHAIQDNTNLVLVTLNNTTVNAWMQRRQKRADRDALLKGTDLPALSVSKRPIPKRSKPTTQRQPGHNILTFNEPDNREGQLSKRPRKRIAAPAIRPAMLPASAIQPAMLPAAVIPPAMLPAPAIQPPVLPAAAQQQIAQWPPMIWQLPSQQTVPVVSSNFTRQQQWRQRQTAIEDQERMERGEPPVKRHKTLHRYICKACGKEKTSQTGHTQTKGKWYCPSMGMSVEEWRGQLKK